MRGRYLTKGWPRLRRMRLKCSTRPGNTIRPLAWGFEQESSYITANPVARPARSMLTGVQGEARAHALDILGVRSEWLGHLVFVRLDTVSLENDARRAALFLQAVNAEIIAQ